ncbi:MAG: response regulator [Lachnospiraceae bacterium]|nr:response regulator [Lachnospiraceae bacterium]
MYKKSRRGTIIIALITLLMIVMTVIDMMIIFRITSQQTRLSGLYKLKSITGELESTINDAELLTVKLALEAEPLVGTGSGLVKYIYEKRESLPDTYGSLMNVYIAGTGWDVLPGLINREGFNPLKRSWYVGAAKKPGETYVTPPYVDAVSGDICYTVSVMLPDRDTVLAVDYTMEEIQAHISALYNEGVNSAVIVTEEGIIAGCSDEDMIGKRLVDVHPEYEGIFALTKKNTGVQTARVRAGLFYDNLFAAQSGSGWYLIESENDWELYKQSYLQLVFILIMTLVFFGIIIVLYVISVRGRKKAEFALETQNKYFNKLVSSAGTTIKKIMECSDNEYVRISDDSDADFARIHTYADELLNMVGELNAYTAFSNSSEGKWDKTGKYYSGRSDVNRRIRTWVVIFLVIVMLVSLYINMNATYKWGNLRMQNDVAEYEYKLSEWINSQKSILDMFCSIVSTNPDMLDNYEETVNTLNDITVQYPDISVSYMTNPDLEHTVYMNNGWEPDSDWKVEDRQWYKDTIASESGWNISAPYYDEQTGLYCLTFSERVCDEDGNFLGNFGIDFYMDKLINILGDSYSDDGYAFLVDAQGEIINHPYGRYQMSVDNIKSVSELPYGELKIDGNSSIVFRDYDDGLKILIANRNEASNFSVYVVSNFVRIYGKMIAYSVIILICFISAIIIVYRQFTGLIRREEEAKKTIQEAADAAIAAGNAKSRFLAQMSHEIRTPINAVLGMNEMILRQSGDNSVKEYASNIKSSGHTLLSLINSILDFSKIEDGKMEIIPVKYELAGLVNNLVNSISERAKNKGLDFDIEIDDGLPCELFGDDVRITQILMNLLTNAVKYTEKGSVTLYVNEVGRIGKECEIEFAVRDTGIGIKKEDMSKLFDSFRRLDEKRNRNIEGTGLGMNIVSRLLEMMGSSLKVDSVYGIGSRFSFKLKQQIADETPIGNYEDRVSSMHKNEEEESLVKLENADIVIVDDNEMNLKVAAGLFNLFGIEPDLAHSGKEAIDMVSKKHYDMIFLDHMMPGMDGIETLKNMRDNGLISDGTIVIALTANAVVGAKETYLAATFDDYLSKPIEIKKLNDKFMKYMPEKIVGRA